MKTKSLRTILSALTTSLIFSGCTSPVSVVRQTGGTADPKPMQAAVRPSLVSPEQMAYTSTITPSLPDYTVADDLSNIVNLRGYYVPEYIREDLRKNLFAVTSGSGFEFHELYESNRYAHEANFITTDSLLHCFHLYYAYLQKNVERKYLRDHLISMSEKLVAESQRQYEEVKGTAFENAAKRNIDFFSVALALCRGQADLSDSAMQEIDLINGASGMGKSPLFSTQNDYLQDYSQFKPRGYYTEGEDLESYFRAMMWYGQMNFTQREEDLDRSALLASLAIDSAAKEDWESIYQVTAFLVGESDDNCFYEYLPVIETAYGEKPSAATAAAREDAFKTYHSLTASLPSPQINSMIIYENEPNREEAISGFRIMGQRFTVDAAILQKLVYRDVDKNAKEEKRSLPDALDVPAAFGSEEALKILKEYTNVSDFPDYDPQMSYVRKSVAKAPESVWSSSIAAAWLNTLRPVLKEDRSGYPAFMRSTAWTRKNLITFLGSYTELKHDTALYAKQVLSEMGADGETPVDDRGYVEPEPEVFGRLAAMAKASSDGLDSFGMISEEDKSYMAILHDLADRLRIIAEKELRNELPTADEFDLIRTYGAQLEHLWLRTVQTEGHSDYYSTQEFPAALVTDIATDPDSMLCLQIADANPAAIFVIVYFDGGLHITSGSVYQFYQFTNPVSERMTDEEWRAVCESSRDLPPLPEWTRDYASALFFTHMVPFASATVKADKLNVRSGPGLDYPAIQTRDEGDYLYLYEKREADGYTWYLTGPDCWVADQNGKWMDIRFFGN